LQATEDSLPSALAIDNVCFSTQLLTKWKLVFPEWRIEGENVKKGGRERKKRGRGAVKVLSYLTLEVKSYHSSCHIFGLEVSS
jgi:hypothetical protein